MRGKSLLERNGIRGFVSRRTDEGIKNGCGYCLIVASDYERSERLLRSAGIHVRGQQWIEDNR